MTSRRALAPAAALALCARTAGAQSVPAPWDAPASAAPSAPVAEPAVSATGDDQLTLRGGATLRGTVVDLRVGQTVTLRTSAGELRVVPWAELESARGPGFRAVSPPASAAPRLPAVSAADALAMAETREPSTAAGYLRPRPGAVPVVVEADGAPLFVAITTVLPYTTPRAYGDGLNAWDGGYGSPYGPSYGFGTSAGFGRYSGLGTPYYSPPAPYYVRTAEHRRVCSTPCTLYLRPGTQLLHLGGDGRRESEESVEIPAQGVRVRYHSASAAQFAFGQAAMWTGAASMVVGTLLLVNSANCGHLACDYTLPVVFLAAGVLALGIAIPLLVVNATGPAGPPRPLVTAHLAPGGVLVRF